MCGIVLEITQFLAGHLALCEVGLVFIEGAAIETNPQIAGLGHVRRFDVVHAGPAIRCRSAPRATSPHNFVADRLDKQFPALKLHCRMVSLFAQ